MPPSSILPKRSRGRLSAEKEAGYQRDLDAFVELILQIKSSLDFKVSSRGWCYLLEEYGLTKGEFEPAHRLMADLRRSGALPIDIAAEDGARQFAGDEFGWTDPNDFSDEVIAAWGDGGVDRLCDDLRRSFDDPDSFCDLPSLWQENDSVVLMMVEKIDLKTLFSPICGRYGIPIANARGWSDINLRAKILHYFAPWHDKQCVLLYCGDHDPAGLGISDSLRRNLGDLGGATYGGNKLAVPPDLVIDRFGLNADFIEAEGLSWIDNLETSSGRSLADPKHKDHGRPYVQNYLAKFGSFKVEANALVVAPKAGRRLCQEAIDRFIPRAVTRRWRNRCRAIQSAAHYRRDEVIQAAIDDGRLQERVVEMVTDWG